MLSDSISPHQLANGDEALFSKLYNLYWEMLYRYVVHVLQDKEDAMDVVQDTFITIWQQRDDLTKVQSLKGYLYAIARYKALKCIRNNIKKHDYFESLMDFFTLHEESPEDMMIADELQGIIDAQIELLPPKMREVFVLSRQNNLSYKEIAALLNISDKTVKKQISNSLKLIRLKIGAHNFPTLYLLVVLKHLLPFIN